MSFVPAALDKFLVEDGLIWLFEPDVLFCAFEGIIQDVMDAKGTCAGGVIKLVKKPSALLKSQRESVQIMEGSIWCQHKVEGTGDGQIVQVRISRSSAVSKIRPQISMLILGE